jgi:putative ABC transport system permease protein
MMTAMTAFARELRYAFRALAKTPGFSFAAITILTLGIGATTALFGVVHTILFAPLGLTGESRLVRLRDFVITPDGQRQLTNTSGRSFEAIREQNRVFDIVVAWSAGGRTIPGPPGQVPERVSVVRVSDGLSRTVGVGPVVGRDFTDAEERAGADARVVQISHALWMRRFGGQRSAIGSVLMLDRLPFTVVGVLPAGFRFPYDADAWTPDRMLPQDEPAVFAHLKREVSLQRTRSDLATIAARLKAQHPEIAPRFGIDATPARQSLFENEQRIAVALLVVIAFFLLLACADVANLLLARSVARRREASIRAALGASRSLEVARAVAEALSVSIPAAAAGLLLSAWLATPLSELVPDNLRLQLGVAPARLDGRMLGFAVILAVLTAVACAVLPALRVSAGNLDRVLREEGRGVVGGRETDRLLSTVVVGQMSLALVLLSAAALFANHLATLARRSVGFTPDRLLTLRVDLPPTRYPRAPERIAAVSAISSAVSVTGGVAAVGVTTVNPLRGGTWVNAIEVEGAPRTDAGAEFVANYRLITPGLFASMGIPLVFGRDFSARDGETAPPVAIVSRRLASHFWPNQTAIGRRVRLGRVRSANPWRTVVGVAGDVEDAGEVRETWYLPYAQRAWGDAAEEIVLMVRTSGSAESAAKPVRLAIAGVDPDLAAFDVSSMAAVRRDTLARERFGARIGGASALLGVLISALGIAGLISYRVAQQQRETAIRIVLGALRRQIVAGILRQGGRVIVVGLAAGAAGTVALDRILRHLVPALESFPASLVAALAALLGFVGLISLAVPAIRAAGADPMSSLRS